VTVLAGGCHHRQAIQLILHLAAPPAPTASVVDATCAVATGTITVTATTGSTVYLFNRWNKLPVIDRI
jgi:hypothetical protein